jgi:hypothetical protein
MAQMLFPNLNEPEKLHLYSGRGVAQTYRCWLFLTVLSSSALVSLSGRLLAQQFSAQFSPSY